jgi:hypothetical protein
VKKNSIKNSPEDFEEFGYQTMRRCFDIEQAVKTCAESLHAFELALRPKLQRLHSEIVEIKNRILSLHSYLYDRPVPVNDAQMLSHSRKIRILIVFALLTAIACLVGNMTTFYLWGFGFVGTFLSAVGLTALPLAMGHLAYEWIISTRRWIQLLVVLVAVGLTGTGILMVGLARRDMIDRSLSEPSVNSYVAGTDVDDNHPAYRQNREESSESTMRHTFGEGVLLITLAAELGLAFLVGVLVRLHTDDDHTAWTKHKRLTEERISAEEKLSELATLPEIARKCCLAGIMRAQNTQPTRHPPYHRALTILPVIVLIAAHPVWAQNIERYEAILVDTSGSISRAGKTNELFQEYLRATRKLLRTEPPNTRVWVETIVADSFSGNRQVLKGWTPEARGVFVDDLNRAREQLASSFEMKSSGMAPIASGTDLFGALWRLRALFESKAQAGVSPSMPTTIWILSDMMNETKELPMPELINKGPHEMLARAKSGGLIVPLDGYVIHIYGASTRGLTPQAWTTVKDFWVKYFSVAGADLVVYSAECDVRR